MTVDVASTGLRDRTRRQLETIGTADLLIGVPAYNNDATIQYVLETVAEGADRYFSDLKTCVMVSDGGSLDETRERAREAEIPEGMERVVTIYRGLSGKGSAFRTIFEAGGLLDVRAALVVDSDLRHWPPAWVHRHLAPVLEEGLDFMVPHYIRHKYDATITNNVCFPMTSALYGRQVRQPIGGDFALSGDLLDHFAREGEWDTDVARFGVDIWMTTTALCEGFEVGQTNLGAKIHDPKDPGESLGPMFRQVVGTLFWLSDRYRDQWWDVESIREVPRYGEPVDHEPDPVSVNRPGLERRAREGWRNASDRIRSYLGEETRAAVERVMNASSNGEERIGRLSVRDWARILYDYAVAYHRSGDEPEQVVDSLVPLYFARCAALFHEMDPMDGTEAETYLQELVREFQAEKDYLRSRWERARV